MKQTQRGVLALLTAALLGFSSCSKAPASTAEGSSKSIDGFNESGVSLKVLDVGNTSVIKLLSMISAIKYPDMSVEIISKESYGLESDADFYNKISGEIMSGKGPDIISPTIFKNMYKAAENGVFENLSPFIEADDGFNKANYSEAILQASSYDGSFIFVPLSLQIPLYVTTKEFDQKYGFNNKSLYDIVNIHAENNITGNPFEHYYEPLFINDYKAEASGLGEPQFLAFLKERRKLISNVKPINNIPMPHEDNPLIYVPGMPCLDTVATVLTHSAAEPVILPAYDEQSKFTAYLTGLGINANSQSKQNAYRFLSLAFTMHQDIEEVKKLKNGAEQHQSYLSLISPAAYNLYANLPMQEKLFNEQFRMYNTGTLYSSDNSIIDAAKLPQENLISQYLALYNELDRCSYSQSFRYTGDIADYVYKKTDLSDIELSDIVKKEYDKAKLSLSE